MVNFTFSEKTHEYKVKGVTVPSVTQIISACGLTDFSGINVEVVERAQAFGKAVHKAVELKVSGTLDEDSVDDAIKPTLQGWDNFVEDFGFVCHGREVQGYHPVYRYAYTMDLLGSITNGKYTGYAVGDIKTGALKPADKIQLAAYRMAAGKQYKNIFILYLNPEFYRGYKIEFSSNTKREEGIFLSCLSVFNFRKEKGLL